MAEAAPAAQVSADVWLSDPDAAAAASWQLIGGLYEAAQSLGWWAYVVGAVGVAVPIVRQFLPGIWGWALDGAWRILARSSAVKADEAAHRIRLPVQRVVREIRDNPTLLPTLREHLPADLRDEFDLLVGVVIDLERDPQTKA